MDEGSSKIFFPGGDVFLNYLGKKIADEAQKLEDETARVERIKRAMRWKNVVVQCFFDILSIPFLLLSGLSMILPRILLIMGYLSTVFITVFFAYGILAESCYHVNYGVCKTSPEFNFFNTIAESIMSDIISYSRFDICETPWFSHFMELRFEQRREQMAPTQALQQQYVCFNGPQGPEGAPGIS
jgi:hypothetical protein